MALQQEQRITVADEEAGERLDRVLAGRLDGLTRSRLKSLIEAGLVSLDGETIGEPSRRVKPGQTFAIVIPEAEPAVPIGQVIALDILFEDADIVVIDKPAGMVVHPAPGNPDRTLVNALIAHCGPSLTGVGGVRRPGIVHRLDKDTSGLMVVAKNDAAHQALVAQFAARSVRRIYGALVWGTPQPVEGEITGNIGRSPRNRKKMAVVARGGRPAVTRYRVRRSFARGQVSLLDCRLGTGRTHQIRVHLSEKGHPLLGDPIYGRRAAQRARALPEATRERIGDLPGQALHARTLGFVHPKNREQLLFEREFPEQIKNLISTLESF